jgi:predicted nucleotidyltransferase
MLAQADQEIFAEFLESIHPVFPEADVWAYGSRAKGKAQPESDLDVCVVLEEVDWDKRKAVSDIGMGGWI